MGDIRVVVADDQEIVRTGLTMILNAEIEEPDGTRRPFTRRAAFAFGSARVSSSARVTAAARMGATRAASARSVLLVTAATLNRDQAESDGTHQRDRERTISKESHHFTSQ